MRVLLDECLPERLRRNIPGHDVFTAHYMGWKTLRNGQLIAAMLQEKFDVLITADRGLPYQQNLQAAGIAVIVLAGRTEYVELVKLAPRLLQVIAAIQPGQFVEISR